MYPYFFYTLCFLYLVLCVLWAWNSDQLLHHKIWFSRQPGYLQFRYEDLAFGHGIKDELLAQSCSATLILQIADSLAQIAKQWQFWRRQKSFWNLIKQETHTCWPVTSCNTLVCISSEDSDPSIKWREGQMAEYERRQSKKTPISLKVTYWLHHL